MGVNVSEAHTHPTMSSARNSFQPDFFARHWHVPHRKKGTSLLFTARLGASKLAVAARCNMSCARRKRRLSCKAPDREEEPEKNGAKERPNGAELGPPLSCAARAKETCGTP